MESISRMSGLLETTRDLTLDAARDVAFLRKGAQQPLRTPQLKKLLDSRHEREVLEGLRQVISISQRPPQPTGPPLLFSSVVKNIASPSIPVRKLVYIYLLQYAEAEPDTALLSINTIQKSLSSTDPQLRALALRVMSGIRVPVISQIVSLAIKKGCADMSPLVRKSAALAIPKCWRLDPAGTSVQLEEYLSQLLGDRQYYVAGAAVIAFADVCPDRLDLLHKHYRSIVRKLVDMDEWSQLATLRVMLNYARKCFPPRSKRVRKTATPNPADTSIDAFYGNQASATQPLPTEQSTQEDSATSDEYETTPIIDPDLSLLLNAAQPLLQSRNAAVIIAVTRLYLYLEPRPHPNTPPNPASATYLSKAIGPLISLLRSGPEITTPSLHNIIQVALLNAAPFVRYATHFLLRATDSPTTHSLKLELLTLVFPHAPPHLQSLILHEASHFCGGAKSLSGSSGSGSSSPRLVRDCVRAIGRCAQACEPASPTATRCMHLLLGHLGSPDGVLVAESLTVIRHLIQADPAAHVGTVVRLAKNLDTLSNPEARASVIWLVGEFAGIRDGDNVAADVLRILAKGFKDEHTQVKLQIVLLAAKVYIHYLNGLGSAEQVGQSNNETAHRDLANDYASLDEGGTTGSSTMAETRDTTDGSDISDQPIPKLYEYIQLLTRYDTSYDLRDRARLYKSLLSTPSSTQLASLLLLAPKPTPSAPSPSESRKDFTLGSASLIIGADEAGAAGLAGYEQVPPWVEDGKEPDPKLRDVEGEAVVTFKERSTGPSASDRLDVYTRGSAVSFNPNTADVNVEKDIDAGIAAPQIAEKSLDDWLAEDDEGESETQSESDESEQDESEEEETDDEESNEQENLVR